MVILHLSQSNWSNLENVIMFGNIGNLGSLLGQLVDGKSKTSVFNPAAGIDPQLLAKLGPALQKAAYIAALHKAIAKAEKSVMFNLEAQKNDLWVSLGNISNQNVKNSTALQAIQSLFSSQQQMFSALSNMTKQMSSVSNQIMQNMK